MNNKTKNKLDRRDNKTKRKKYGMRVKGANMIRIENDLQNRGICKSCGLYNCKRVNKKAKSYCKNIKKKES